MEAEQELKRKRERGRQAQAAFRKRQAKAAQSVQEENSQLREAIESIVQAASRSDGPELLSVIRQAAVAAGVEAKHLEVSAAGHVALSTNEGVDCRRYESFDDTQDTVLGSALINFGASESRAVPPPHTEQSLPTPCDHGQFLVRPAEIHEHHNNSRRRCTICRPGPLYTWGLALLGCPGSRHKCVSHSKSLSKVGPEFIHAMAKSRQHWLQGGQSDGIHAMVTKRSSIAATRQMVDDDHASKGTDTSAWLLPNDVEGRVRQRLGQEIFGRLENAAKAPESSQAHRALRETIHKMVDAFMCFGNGPSWTGNYVDLIFSEWAALEAQRC
ncbi:bZIP transcription factor domain-containing protein [Apiospora kogelbergensis]|uniref:bZIP transcription factor domain-containing protein n=1 Tax=Apiospora kogelbergensis TaxID=1337665 RepID=UPI00312ECBE0